MKLFPQILEDNADWCDMPEKRMLCEFVAWVIRDLKSDWDPKSQTSAKVWLNDSIADERTPFSLAWCAMHLGIERRRLKEAIIRTANDISDRSGAFVYDYTRKA